jgi:TRAP-type mannitol/chloroaromatic compound transport system substrate-binding protein
MFKAIAEEHRSEQPQKKAIRELEQRITDHSLPDLGAAITAPLNSATDRIIVNQKDIDRHAKEVRDEWLKFGKELDKWQGLISDLDRAVADLGDVYGWAKTIQAEIDAISGILSSKSPA